MLKIKPATDRTIRIPIDCPGAEGFIIGHLAERTRAEREAKTADVLHRITELRKRHEEGEIGEAELLRETGAANDELIRLSFSRFSGLPEDVGDSMDYVLNGPLSQWLTAAALAAVNESIERARRGNSSGSRGR